MHSKARRKRKERVGRIYGLRVDKGNIHVINFLKQRITTAGTKIRRYNRRNLRYHKNNIFRNDQRQFYKELDGKTNGQIQIQMDQLSFEASYCLNHWSTI